MSEQPLPDTQGNIHHYNPVHVQETIGTIFLGILAIILLIALLRSRARVQQLEAEA